jgi:P4 family phage/plasmid primase-like protien
MLNIPLALKQNQRIRYLRLYKDTKKPIGEDWNNLNSINNYSYDELEKAHQEGEGTGLLMGTGSPPIVIVDVDNKEGNDFFLVQGQINSFLPKTLQVKTPSGGTHNYYYCKDFDKIEESYVPLKNKNGEIRIHKCNVAIPPTEIKGNKYEIVYDVPIADVSIDTIFACLARWLDINENEEEEQPDNDQDKIPIEKFLDLDKLTKKGKEYYGVHPLHGATNGMNFWVNLEKNCWHCFRHRSGGSALEWLAVKEGFIECEHAKKGKLRGKLFVEVAKRAEAILGKKILKDKSPLSNLSNDLKDSGDWLEFAKRFVAQNGVFYDKTKLWWWWDSIEYYWKIVDETDLLNMVDYSLDNQPITIRNNIKAQIIEALKRQGRLNCPKQPKESWIQFKDKIVDVDTGQIFDSTKEYFFTNPIPHKLGISKEMPIMDKLFSEWVVGTDQQLLYEIIAFCLSPRYFIHDIFCFTGSGSNGKSKYMGLVKNFIGGHNCCATDLDILMANRFESAKLYKKLAAFMGETNFNVISKTSLLKRLVGEDLVGFEFKGKNGFDDTNYSKIFISTNTLPATEDKTKGFYRRWLNIEFPNEFNNDIDILATIPEVEYENLCVKCVNLLHDLRIRRKFTNEPTVEEKAKKYEERSNPMTTFIADTFVKDINGEIPFFTFYDEYLVFLDQRGFRKQSKKEVSTLLDRDGYNVERKCITIKGEPKTWYFVIGIRTKNPLGV